MSAALAKLRRSINLTEVNAEPPAKKTSKQCSNAHGTAAALADEIADPAPDAVIVLVAAEDDLANKHIAKPRRDPPEQRYSEGGSSGSRNVAPPPPPPPPAAERPHATRTIKFTTDQQRVRDAIGAELYDEMRSQDYAIYWDRRIGRFGGYSARFRLDGKLKTVPGSLTHVFSEDDESHNIAICDVFNEHLLPHAAACCSSDEDLINAEMPPGSDADDA